jgi:hypothetical protein
MLAIVVASLYAVFNAPEMKKSGKNAEADFFWSVE